MIMSDSDEQKHGEGFTENEWRTAWEQEAEENKQLRKRITELERSAVSAREIARVAMSHTGTRCIRAEFFRTDHGLQLVVCDPAGDERATTKQLAKLLDVGLWSTIGLQFDKEPSLVGSSD